MIVLFIRVLLGLAFAGLLYWVLLKLIPPKLFTIVGGIVVLILIGFSFYNPTQVVSVPDPIWKLFIFPFKPLGLALILLAVALFRIFKDSKDQILKTTSAIAFALIFLFSVPVVNQELVKLYERGFLPKSDQAQQAATVMVLLGQDTTAPLAPYGNAVQLTDSGDRLIYTAKLYQAQPQKPLVIISAGQRHYFNEQNKPLLEGEDIAKILRGLVTIPDGNLIVDNASRDIRSSAINIKKILEDQKRKDQPILLITSALHMWRSKLTFEKVGLKVIPSATDFHSLPSDTKIVQPLTLEDFLPNATSLELSTQIVEDFFGFVYYFLRGWLIPKL